MATLIEKAKDIASRLQTSESVVKVVLFGSVAKGTAVEGTSDIDILVVVKKPHSFAEKRELIDRLYRLKGRDSSVHVDLLVLDEEDYQRRLPTNLFYQTIESQGIHF